MMRFDDAYIPYGVYWSTPFARWQGSLADSHSIELAAQTARAAMEHRSIPAEELDGLALGITVAQRRSFYGAPWLAGLLGAPGVTGPNIGQACATSARLLVHAAHEVQGGAHQALLLVACDRTSNGPHVYYPAPSAPGGRGKAEDPVLDNFAKDPWAGGAMVQTAEAVAAQAGIDRQEQDEVALLRFEQYQQALADDRAFQRRYMQPVELRRGRKVVGSLDADEGVHPTTPEGLAKLRPVQEGGTVTFGTQTHPADGNAGMVVCSAERAAALSADPAITVRLRAYGQARVGKGLMPMAVVPAARQALQRADLDFGDLAAVKTHNPFAVNDVYFCRETGLAPSRVNNYGSPLVFGHPQAPTGLRCVIELIEELVLGGGGAGLFSGCAAGDTAMAVVIEVGV